MMRIEVYIWDDFEIKRREREERIKKQKEYFLLCRVLVLEKVFFKFEKDIYILYIFCVSVFKNTFFVCVP